MNYSDWLKYRSRLANRDISKDEKDYDLESYFKSLKSTMGESGKFNPEANTHLPDTYKKPNHPTFSNESIYSIPGIQEGGEWNESTSNWEFTPSELNLRNMPAEDMESYFEKADPEAKLNLSKKFNKLKSKINR